MSRRRLTLLGVESRGEEINGSDYIGGNYSLGGSVLSAQGGERTQWIGRTSYAWFLSKESLRMPPYSRAYPQVVLHFGMGLIHPVHYRRNSCRSKSLHTIERRQLVVELESAPRG